MATKRKWRKPIPFTPVRMKEVEPWLERLATAPQELVAHGITIAQLEDNLLFSRWNESPRLIFRVSSRIVRILTESDFEDVRASDIYLPEGIDVLQIIPEEDDPLCSHSLAFFLPTEQFPNYYLLTSDGTNSSRLLVKPEQRVSDFAEETITDDMVDPRYLSLIAAIGFVADNDQYGLIRHLVLNNDAEKYERARSRGDAEAMRQIERRAFRRHKNERIVDTFELDLGEVDRIFLGSVANDPASSKRPHVRRGHFRKVRHGEGRKSVKYKWFPPTIVRRDLLTSDEERLLRPNG